MEIIEVNDQFLITRYRNLINTDCVSWIVARISGTFQRVANDRTTIWPKKKKKEDRNEIGDVSGADVAFNDSSVYRQSLQYRIHGIRI